MSQTRLPRVYWKSPVEHPTDTLNTIKPTLHPSSSLSHFPVSGPAMQAGNRRKLEITASHCPQDWAKRTKLCPPKCQKTKFQKKIRKLKFYNARHLYKVSVPPLHGIVFLTKSSGSQQGSAPLLPWDRSPHLGSR